MYSDFAFLFLENNRSDEILWLKLQNDRVGLKDTPSVNNQGFLPSPLQAEEVLNFIQKSAAVLYRFLSGNCQPQECFWCGICRCFPAVLIQV